MKTFTFFKGQLDTGIPPNHHIISVSPVIYQPYTFSHAKKVYHKHNDPNMEQIHSFMIEPEHPLWNYNQDRMFTIQ